MVSLPNHASSAFESVVVPAGIDLICEENLRQRPRRHRRHADDPHQSDHEGPRPRRCAGESRNLQSGELDQGPDGGSDDRGRRARRPAQTWRDHHRRHVRQHRHGPRDRGRRQGLPVHLHDDGQAVEGESGRAQGVRCRGDRLPDERRPRRSTVVLLRVVEARTGSAGLVEGEPVRQPVEHESALRADGPRDLGADRRRHHPSGRRRGDRRDDLGRRPLPQGA